MLNYQMVCNYPKLCPRLLVKLVNITAISLGIAARFFSTFGGCKPTLTGGHHLAGIHGISQVFVKGLEGTVGNRCWSLEVPMDLGWMSRCTWILTARGEKTFFKIDVYTTGRNGEPIRLFLWECWRSMCEHLMIVELTLVLLLLLHQKLPDLGSL